MAGYLSNTANLNAIVEDGVYLGLTGNSITGKPLGIGGASFVLRVSAYGTGSGTSNRFVLQELYRLSDPTCMWIRRVDQQDPNSTSEGAAWVQPAAVAPPPGPLAGKRAVFFGDSITDFGDFHLRVQARLGLASAVNSGFGGCRMALHPTTLFQPFSMYNVAQTVAAGGSLVSAANALYADTGTDFRVPAADLAAVNWSTTDFAVIFYGTNDYGGANALGTPGSTDVSTVRGAINVTVDALQSAYPHLQILFLTPMWRARLANGDGKDATNHPNSAGIYLREYADAIIDEAGRNACPVLDMYRTSGINAHTHTHLLYDGLHLNGATGWQRAADKIAAAMSAHF